MDKTGRREKSQVSVTHRSTEVSSRSLNMQTSVFLQQSHLADLPRMSHSVHQVSRLPQK
jgi:hypothetical protein